MITSWNWLGSFKGIQTWCKVVAAILKWGFGYVRLVFIFLALLSHPTGMHTAKRKWDGSDVKSVPWFSSDCPADGRTWVPFEGKCYHFVHGEEDKIKSYTFERAKTLCQGFGTWLSLFFQKQNEKIEIVFSTLCLIMSLYIALLFLELLTIQSAKENDFVIKYSPEVWKGIVNVWLGMYYDTNSKYHVTRRPMKTWWITSIGQNLILYGSQKGKKYNTFLQLFGENNLKVNFRTSFLILESVIWPPKKLSLFKSKDK